MYLGLGYNNNDGQYIAHHKQLSLRSVYQPIYQRDFSIIGLEALVRNSNQDRQMIRPDQFFQSNAIPVKSQINAERLSLLNQISNFGRYKFSSKKFFLNVLPKAT